MAAAAKKQQPDPAAGRRPLVLELLDLTKKHDKVFARETELKSALKTLATEGGNFKDVVPGKGEVSASGKKEKQFLGTAPEIVPQAFNALSKTEQARLVKSGLVKMTENYSGAYYGAVTVKLF